jgi:acyl-CoA synthetase (AMP-forming)/AMP-acid ligase II
VLRADEHSEPTEAELLAWARQRLAPYKIPVTIVSIDAIPLNASLKVSRPELRKLISRNARERDDA